MRALKPRKVWVRVSCESGAPALEPCDRYDIYASKAEVMWSVAFENRRDNPSTAVRMMLTPIAPKRKAVR